MVGLRTPSATENFLEKWPETGLASVLIVALAFLAYANSFPGIFVLDDLSIVQNNPLLEKVDVLRIFCSDYWGTGLTSGLYRPLTILSLALNRLCFGEAALGYHLVNVLLHAGVALLLLRVLLLWGVTLPVATLAAALFIVHPIHTEVVDVVVGRSELLVALFLLAGFCLAQRESWPARLLASGCYVLALLSKEHAIMFLVLLPLVHAFSSGTLRSWQRHWPLYATLLTLTVIWLSWRNWGVVHTIPRDIDVNALAGLPVLTRILSALALQTLYLSKLIWPAVLQINYKGHDFSAFIIPPLSFAGLVVTLVFSASVILIIRGWKRQSLWALCAVFYVTSFIPMANIFFLPGVTFAERLAYFPSAWFSSGIAVLFIGGVKNVRIRKFCTVVAILYVSALGVRLVARNMDFRSLVTLWSIERESDPRNPYAWQGLAEAYHAQGRFAEAEQAYRQLLRLPNGDNSQALMSWTLFLANRNRLAEAVVVIRRSVKLRQDAHVPAPAEMWILASFLVDSGQFEEALFWLDRRREYYGNAANDWDIRGEALQGLGRFVEAATAYAQIDIWPTGTDGPLRYASCLYQLGRLEESGSQLQQLLLRDEKNAEAWNLLGSIAARQEAWREATAALSQAVLLSPDNRHYQDNLQKIRRGEQF